MSGSRAFSGAVTVRKRLKTHVASPSSDRFRPTSWPLTELGKRACTIKHVSEAGAALLVESSIEGLALKEFFLLLSSTGLAYRRCELNWVNGGEIGVNFLRQRNKRTKSKESSDVA
jgi:hypothetical protein